MGNVKSITPLPPADFTPDLGNYKTLQPFRYWCQKVLPLVYDDSLSYYELLCKVVDYLNKTMEDVETLHGDVTNIHTAYDELQSYVNNYFSTLDVQVEINNKLDEMAKNGELSEIINNMLLNLRYVNVCNYGADPSGVAASDDSFINAINVAINKNYALFIPCGIYKITKKIVITGYKNNYNTFKIICNNSVIKSYVNNDYTLQLKGGKFNISGGLTINGFTANCSGVLLDDESASIDYDAIFGSYFSDISITNCNVAYAIGEVFDTSFYNIIARDNTTGILWKKANFSNANSINFYDADIQGRDVLMALSSDFSLTVGINFYGGHFEKYRGFNKTAMTIPMNCNFWGTRFAINKATDEVIDNFNTPYIIKYYNVFFYGCTITAQNIVDYAPAGIRYFKTGDYSHHISFVKCTIAPCYGNAGNLNKNNLVDKPDVVTFEDVMIIQQTLIISDPIKVNFSGSLGWRYTQRVEPTLTGFRVINRDVVNKTENMVYAFNENYTKMDNKEITKFKHTLNKGESYYYAPQDISHGLYYICIGGARALFCCGNDLAFKEIFCDADIDLGGETKLYSIKLGGNNLVVKNVNGSNNSNLSIRII